MVESVNLQRKVIKDVYLDILAELISGQAVMVNKVAYLTVLIGLTDAISKHKIQDPFKELVVNNYDVCRAIEKCLIRYTDVDLTAVDEFKVVRFEKAIFYNATLLDLVDEYNRLNIKHEYSNVSFQNAIILKIATILLRESLASEKNESVIKMCRAKL